MKALMNSPQTLASDALDGFCAAHADIVAMAPSRKYLRCRTPERAEVLLVSGGGGGHEPLHAGFVGLGMLDAACPGQIFTAPAPDQIVEAAQDLAGEAGVLFIVKNYDGDRMNFEMAAEMFAGRHATLRVEDDVSDDWSGQQDSNLRPEVPKTSALPGCAIPRSSQTSPNTGLRAAPESASRRARSRQRPDVTTSASAIHRPRAAACETERPR